MNLRWFLILLFLVNACSQSELPAPSVSTSEQGGANDHMIIQLPFAAGERIHCTQGAHGDVSHTSRATKYDLDLDTSNVRDESLFAPISGRAYVHEDDRNFGLHVNIQINSDTYLVLGHLHKAMVRDGEMVEVGALIGLEGCTGYCTGDHVHIGVHQGDASQNAKHGESIPARYATIDGNLLSEEFSCGLSVRKRYIPRTKIAYKHPNGTLLHDHRTGRNYRLERGFIREMNYRVKQTYEYQSDDFIPVSKEELDCYREGEYMDQEGMVEIARDMNGEYWLIVGPWERLDRYRIRMPSHAWREIAISWGLEFYQDESINPLILGENTHHMRDWPIKEGYALFRDGTLLKERADPKVVIVSDGALIHIENMQIFRLLRYDERRIQEISDGLMHSVHGFVGDCFRNNLCLKQDAISYCDRGIEFGGVYAPQDIPPQSEYTPDAGLPSDSSAQVDAGFSEDAGIAEDAEIPVIPQERSLYISWTTPGNRLAHSIRLSGEYLLSQGGIGFLWNEQLTSMNDAADIDYVIDRVQSGDIFRFSVEYHLSQQSGPGWSCIHYPDDSYELQGSAHALVDGQSVQVELIGDPRPGVRGCGLLVRVP